jgi:lipoprotein signal peptidase
MRLLLAGLIFVPLLDQGVKWVVLARLGTRSISLGLIGKLEVVRTRVWLVRLSRRVPALAWGLAWSLAAAALAVITLLLPANGWAAGLLLGGSLSHLLEGTIRGWICDYVCLRFWPAFNLADVAICAGALGLVAEVIFLLFRASP